MTRFFSDNCGCGCGTESQNIQKYRNTGSVTPSSVRLPTARANQAPAISGRGLNSQKKSAPVSPTSAEHSAICHAPAKPRLPHVHVVNTGKNASRIRRQKELRSTLESWKKKYTHAAASTLASARAGNPL